MAKAHIKPEDRKNEIEEVKKDSKNKPVLKYGQPVNSQYAGKKELPVKEPFTIDRGTI
jgi:hypothetical protein